MPPPAMIKGNNYTIKVESEDKEKIKKIITPNFIIQPTKSVEVTTFNANILEVKKILTALEGEEISKVAYSEHLVENKDMPQSLMEELSALEKPIHLLKDLEIINKIKDIPSITPQKFFETCQMMRLENENFSYFEKEAANLFPYHPEPFKFETSNEKIRLRMSFSRGIFFTNKYNTQTLATSSYNPKNGSHLEEIVNKVKQAISLVQAI